ADIGAGTGLATALLHARGAEVIAVEPGSGMAAEFRRGLPGVPLVLGDGNALPLARNARHFATGHTLGKSGRPVHPADPTGRLRFTDRRIRWSRRVPAETHLANITSHSLFLLHDRDRTAAFLTEERAHLLEQFPDGIVEETYVVELLLAKA
ncbi:MAG: SAM-dependent methyltransferase, partial [Streptomyces sp.]|nr:SAM-dependent methyltransferase [Streptomyces sp.]